MNRRKYLYSLGSLLTASSFAGCFNSTTDDTYGYANKKFTVGSRNCGAKQNTGEMDYIHDENTVKFDGVISGRSQPDTVELVVFSSQESNKTILNVDMNNGNTDGCDRWVNIQYKGKVEFGEITPPKIYLIHSTPMGGETVAYLTPEK